jgi:D-alanine-D-alanine ligase
MSSRKVVILVPPEDPAAAADRADTFVQARQLDECLTMLGNATLTMTFDTDRAATERALKDARPGLVVNLVEDLPEGADQVWRVTEVLDRLGLRYTGAPSEALATLGDKREMKRRLVAAGLPVAADLASSADDWEGLAEAPSPYPLSQGRGEDVARDVQPLTSPSGGEGGAPRRVRGLSEPAPAGDGRQRYIVKSAIEHASIGIDAGSVVSGRAAAEALIARRRREFGGEWFAEAFIDGREFNVAVLETRAGPIALPVAEILFLDHADRPRIVGYEEKWAEESAAYVSTPRSFPRDPADAALRAELARLALASWRLFGLKGYARVDFRVDDRGRPYILEVNANPCLAADAGFCAAAGEAGMTQTDVVARLIEAALA